MGRDALFTTPLRVSAEDARVLESMFGDLIPSEFLDAEDDDPGADGHEAAGSDLGGGPLGGGGQDLDAQDLDAQDLDAQDLDGGDAPALGDAAGDGSRAAWPVGAASMGAVSVLRSMFEAAQDGQQDLNRRAARRAEDLADALAHVRDVPWVYALPDDEDPVGTAVRCAVLELSLRLTISETAVRLLAHTADTARDRLPALWRAACDGDATIAHVDAVIELLPAFDRHPAGVLARFDQDAAELAVRMRAGSFRRRAQQLARKAAPTPAATAHADAAATRRVAIEDAPDGMSWLHVFLPTVHARAAFRRATSTAKHLTRQQRDERSRDQIRADLFRDWLTGAGTDRPVKTKVYVTIPLDRLAPEARASVRAHAPGRPGGAGGAGGAGSAGGAGGAGLDLNAEALIPGQGPVDDATARQIFLDVGAFTRVITDPVTGVILDMDRRSRTATPAQRAWLALRHGTCRRDGCERLAVDADIDHWCPWHGPGRGPTNIANLDPLCGPDHTLKDRTRIRYRKRPDQSVQLEFPTGYRTLTPERLAELLTPQPVPENPPF